MTVETTTNRVSYTGSGTTGPFSVPFYFLEDDDLTVIKTTIADGTEATMVLTTDYTVSGAGVEAGGSVTLVATLSSSYKLTIIRNPDLLQDADYPQNDRFPAATHERALDKLTMITQRLKDLIDRSFRLSDGDTSGISLILSNLAAGNLIAINSAGDGIESIAAADVDLATVSAFILTLLDDANAATARTTLGAAALGANTFTGLQTQAASADIASATTIDLTAATGNTAVITGTTATTTFTMNAGQQMLLLPSGAWPITYHATTANINGGVDYTCAAGDRVYVAKDLAGVIRVSVVKQDGTAVVGSTLTEGTWTDYAATSTIVGWSSFTTKLIYYKKVGKTVFFTAVLAGTSNSTAVSFTLPDTSSNDVQVNFCFRSTDNGVPTSGGGLANIIANSATVTCYKDMAANAWTGSGTKNLLGSGFYNIP